MPKTTDSNDAEWIEVPVFVHGITLDPIPHDHERDYASLLALINQALTAQGKQPFAEPPIGVEWGWESDQTMEADRNLALAERMIAEPAVARARIAQDITLTPLRMVNLYMRQAFVYGFADLLYYASEDGENAVRRNVFGFLSNQILGRWADKHVKLSLTFIAHSAGTVIVHDLLFNLFRQDKPCEVDEVNQVVHELVDQGRLRIRRFYSFGSPITPTVFRKGALLAKIVNQEKLDPEGLGFRRSDGLSNPRWVNFWDKDDVVAFPVSFLFDNARGEIEDHYLDLGDLFPIVHLKYWNAPGMAKRIAETF